MINYLNDSININQNRFGSDVEILDRAVIMIDRDMILVPVCLNGQIDQGRDLTLSDNHAQILSSLLPIQTYFLRRDVLRWRGKDCWRRPLVRTMAATDEGPTKMVLRKMILTSYGLIFLLTSSMAQDATKKEKILRWKLQVGSIVTYQDAVQWYIADLKTSFPEHRLYSDKTALTEANYIAVLDGLKNNAKVNGIRLPIFQTKARPDTYTQVYKKAIAYARSIGLAIYASPMSVGMSDYNDWSSQQYASWLADYTNYFSLDFLSPFNEANIDDRPVAPRSRIQKHAIYNRIYSTMF